MAMGLLTELANAPDTKWNRLIADLPRLDRHVRFWEGALDANQIELVRPGSSAQ
jgi:hypothetical protein